MDKDEDKISKKSPTRNEDFPYSTKRRTKDFHQLISLHKRFEEDALRFFRRGYVSPPRNSKENKPEDVGSFARDLSRRMMLDYFPSMNYLNDDDYIDELLGNYGERKPSNFYGERFTLKLPTMESISSANKAIFYTTLPKIPSLPAKTENRKNTKEIYSSRNRNFAKNRASRSKDESFLQIKTASLTSKGGRIYEDLNAIKKVRESNREMGSQIQVILPKVGDTKKDKNGREVDGKRGLADQTDCRLSLKNDSNFKKKSKNVETLEKEKEKGLKGDEKSVHFCELLHEVHVYSPSVPSR